MLIVQDRCDPSIVTGICRHDGTINLEMLCTRKYCWSFTVFVHKLCCCNAHDARQSTCKFDNRTGEVAMVASDDVMSYLCYDNLLIDYIRWLWWNKVVRGSCTCSLVSTVQLGCGNVSSTVQLECGNLASTVQLRCGNLASTVQLGRGNLHPLYSGCQISTSLLCVCRVTLRRVLALHSVEAAARVRKMCHSAKELASSHRSLKITIWPGAWEVFKNCVHVELSSASYVALV